MENKRFSYTYSAPTGEERKEVESIQKQYLPAEKKSESKIERLRRLDARVKNGAICASLIVGILGTLLFGLGLSLALEFNKYALGIVFSAIGLIPTASAYFVYESVLMRNKKKYGREILKLSEEILNEEKTNK